MSRTHHARPPQGKGTRKLSADAAYHAKSASKAALLITQKLARQRGVDHALLADADALATAAAAVQAGAEKLREKLALHADQE